MMVRVKIVAIYSTRDPATGDEGKEVVFAAEVSPPIPPLPHAEVVREALELSRAILGVQPRVAPKLILYLSEDEAEALGIRLEVNRRYELKFADGRVELEELGG